VTKVWVPFKYCFETQNFPVNIQQFFHWQTV